MVLSIRPPSPLDHTHPAGPPTRSRPTLQAPELQHQGAVLQVVQQPLGAVGAAEVEAVVQQRVDVVPDGRCVERPAALKVPEPEGAGENIVIMMIINNHNYITKNNHIIKKNINKKKNITINNFNITNNITTTINNMNNNYINNIIYYCYYHQYFL